jgi:formate hydrogenlyase subunit 6/NADH:ubiquinone oxidoreductase subunit I
MEELPDIRIMRERCVFCGDCVRLCPQSGGGTDHPVFSDSGGEVVIESRESCIACFTCVEFCRASAIVISLGPGAHDDIPAVFPARPFDRIV